MAKMVKLTIDGTTVESPEGATLIEAAELAGIHIPNLCYLKGMPGIGACRLCLVEIEGAKAPMIACNTKVKEGMIVNTKTEKIQETRRFVIDLILSMHPLDCMTCTKAGVCNLQQYAYEFGLKESNFTRKNSVIRLMRQIPVLNATLTTASSAEDVCGFAGIRAQMSWTLWEGVSEQRL